MRRLFVGIFASATMAAVSLGVAWSATPFAASQQASAGTPVHRVFYLPTGSLAACNNGLCNDASQDGSLTLPSGHTYRVVVTESFQYRTRGSGKFDAGLHVYGSRSPITPGTRPLLDTSVSTSTTLVYVTRLTGGKQYSIGADVGNSDPAAGATNWFIRASKVLFLLDAHPVRT